MMHGAYNDTYCRMMHGAYNDTYCRMMHGAYNDTYCRMMHGVYNDTYRMMMHGAYNDTYCRMMHGAYNVKEYFILIFSVTHNRLFYNRSLLGDYYLFHRYALETVQIHKISVLFTIQFCISTLWGTVIFLKTLHCDYVAS
jgi:hypothetical protein